MQLIRRFSPCFVSDAAALFCFLYTRLMNSAENLFSSQESAPKSGWITAFCDGGSRGNPGPAGYGVYIQDEKGQKVAELSEFLGKKTNNFAEYSGLLAALDYAITHGHSHLKAVADSELMVKQVKGQYRVNSPELRPLYEEARRRIAQLEGFQIQHVLREKNRHADRLANAAMDKGTGRSSSSDGAPAPKAQTLRGFVKGGVIHLLEGELPDGVFVKVVREG
jgi:probable phosphoglycerate mutase